MGNVMASSTCRDILSIKNRFTSMEKMGISVTNAGNGSNSDLDGLLAGISS